jgi:hypothetical protein
MSFIICVCYQIEGFETDSGVIINPKQAKWSTHLFSLLQQLYHSFQTYGFLNF